MDTSSAEWQEDCLRTYGVVLTGKLAHWCDSWDGLPIDETSPEFEVCTCSRVFVAASAGTES